MKYDSLPLEKVSVHYDTKTGAIVLGSKDPELKGKPFQIKLSANSPTYNTLLELLDSHGLADVNSAKIPSYVKISSAKFTDSKEKQYKTRIAVGKSFENEIIELDLQFSPHTLIAGTAGAGKTVFQRLVIAHALAHSDEIELYGIDVKRVELSPYFATAREKLATTLDDTIRLLEQLRQLLEQRFSLLEIEGKNSYLDTGLKALYLVVDDLALITGDNGVKSSEGRIENAKRVIIEEHLQALASRGRAVGLYLFVAAQRADSSMMRGAFKANFGTRILIGDVGAAAALMLLGARPEFGGALLSNRGRAIVSTYGKQKLFQSYFLKREKLSC